MATNCTPLMVGSKVHCILYGGRDGVIYAIHGKQTPQVCQSLGGGVGVTGGSANFDIVWEDGTESRMIPECLVRSSVQWHILDGFVTGPAIEFMREFAAAESARKQTEAAEAAAKFKTAVEALKVNPAYAHLKQFSDGKEYPAKLAAINLRLEVKKLFPGVKFSIRVRDYNVVDIRWTDGPLLSQVKALTNKYEGGSFDGMEDLYTHSSSPWTTVFGDADYIFENRSHSPDALTEAMTTVCAEYGWAPLQVETSSDGTAYIGCDREDRYRKVYDFIEKRHEYEVQEWTPETARQSVGGTVGT